MSKRNSRNRISLLCLFVGRVGLSPSVFAIDFSKVLQQESQSNENISTLFAGKAHVSNIYEKALKLAKQNELGATQQAIEGVVKYFAKQSCTVSTKDVLYVLYDSNLAFQNFFTHVVISDMKDGGWSVPLPVDIAKSYAHFFSCKKIQHPTVKDYTNLQSHVADAYYQSINGNFMISTMNQVNYGEDLYRNGNKSDSDFDLLVDINDIGNIFFSSFKSTPETLFYALPTITSGLGGGGGGGNNPPGNGGGTGNNTGTRHENTQNHQNLTGLGGISSIDSSSHNGVVVVGMNVAPVSLGSDQTDSDIPVDSDVQQFLTTTNPSSFAQSDYNFVVGSQCTPSPTPMSSEAAKQEETISNEEYISGLIAFIDHANINDIVHDYLLSGANSVYALAAKQNNNKKDTVDAVANTYAEMAFGDTSIGNTVCGSTCSGLPLDEQMACQRGCAKSCIEKCKDLPFEEKTLCVVDCTCFMVSGPQGEGWNMIEDMFNVKFCKVPVQSKSTTPESQNVSSIQQILQAAVDVLQGLKRSGNMVKYTQTKEFLEFDIKLKLSELLDFKIFFAFKPIFAQKAAAAEQRKKTIEAANTTDALLGMSSNIEHENYNKYVIISDIPTNKANLEDLGVAAAQKESLTKQAAVLAAAVNTIKDPISLYQNQKIALLGEDIIGFMNSHQVFRNTFVTSLISMQADAASLKSSIK